MINEGQYFSLKEIFMPYNRRYNILLALLFVFLVPLVTVHAQGITVTAQVQATLRKGPGRDFPPVGVGGVSPNTTVPALGRSADNTWVQVNANGTIGWLSKNQVTVNGDFNALPVTGGQGGQT